MKKNEFTEEQIAFALKQAELGIALSRLRSATRAVPTVR